MKNVKVVKISFRFLGGGNSTYRRDFYQVVWRSQVTFVLSRGTVGGQSISVLRFVYPV